MVSSGRLTDGRSQQWLRLPPSSFRPTFLLLFLLLLFFVFFFSPPSAMDLLNGYGSSSSSSSDESDGDGDDKVAAAAAGGGGRSSTPTPRAKAVPAGAFTVKLPPPVAKRSSDNPVHGSSQVIRGKKMLSFASVLPPHILALLERSQRGEDDFDDENGDDERDGPSWTLSRREGTQAQDGSIEHQPQPSDRKHTPTPAAVAKDERISELLRDLRAAPPATVAAPTPLKTEESESEPAAGRAGTLGRGPGKPFTVNNQAKAAAAPAKHKIPSAHQPLGQAFVTATLTTTVAGKSNRPKAVDIHAPSASSSADGVSKDSSEAGNSPSLQSDEHAKLPPRPLRVSAAPIVRSTGTLAPNPIPVATEAEAKPSPEVQGYAHPTLEAGAHHKTKKRSRQELERALRHGNMAAIQQHQSAVDVRTIHQSDPSERAYQAPEADPSSYYSSAGAVRVGPAPMYDPTTGTIRAAGATGTGGSGGGGSDDGRGLMSLKGRGKNQIHHVVAAAAQLEMQRARQQQHMPSSSSGAGGRGGSNPHRANAKAKYGW
jgi:hypothetical protein